MRIFGKTPRHRSKQNRGGVYIFLKLKNIGLTHPNGKRYHCLKNRQLMEIVINRAMIRRREMSYEECMEKSMSPVQKDVFIIVDEWWKKYGCSPTLRQIADVRGKTGIGNTKDIVDRLVKLGVVKRVAGRRSIRPVYINFRDIE
jgi:hypothetical protein